MTDDIHRLVYYSHNRISGQKSDMTAEIDQILSASRRNNERVGVTGALMFNARYFAQVLEGPRAAIEATFERIQQDVRHGEVSLMSFEPAPRGFPNWSMAFVGSSGPADVRLGEIALESGFDAASLSGERMFEILCDLMVQDAT